MTENLQEIQLSEDAEQVIRIAQAIAKENRNAAFTPAHLLKTLLHKDARLQNVLKQLGIDRFYIEEWAEVRIEGVPKSTGVYENIAGNPLIEEVIHEADNIRLQLDCISILFVAAVIHNQKG